MSALSRPAVAMYDDTDSVNENESVPDQPPVSDASGGNTDITNLTKDTPKAAPYLCARTDPFNSSVEDKENDRSRNEEDDTKTESEKKLHTESEDALVTRFNDGADTNFKHEPNTDSGNESDTDSEAMTSKEESDHEPYRIWILNLKEYTALKLTYPKDKLLAISAIARRTAKALESSKNGDQYLAGLWKRLLPFQMLWKVLESHQRCRPAYRAPNLVMGIRRRCD